MTRKLTPAQLDEIEATAKDEMDSGWRIVLMNPAATLALVAEVRELRAKVERVRELHQGDKNGHCEECSQELQSPQGIAVGHPCDTIKALGEEA